MRFLLLFVAIAVFLFASVLRADCVTVTGSSVDWQQTGPPTFVLPADLTKGIVFCVTRNEPECEPLATCNFNLTFAGVAKLRPGSFPTFGLITRSDTNGYVGSLIFVDV